MIMFSRMNEWRFKLDTNLTGELGKIADWINTAETVLSRELNFDPLKLLPEENIQRFTQLNQEHIVKHILFFFFFFFFLSI